MQLARTDAALRARMFAMIAGLVLRWKQRLPGNAVEWRAMKWAMSREEEVHASHLSAAAGLTADESPDSCAFPASQQAPSIITATKHRINKPVPPTDDKNRNPPCPLPSPPLPCACPPQKRPIPSAGGEGCAGEGGDVVISLCHEQVAGHDRSLACSGHHSHLGGLAVPTAAAPHADAPDAAEA